MWMVAGLGNPGREHTGTRHNIGFQVVERLAEGASIRLSDRRFRARLGRGRLGDTECVLIVPQTYMNLSGEAVGPALGFYKLRTPRLVVIHDDLGLPFGTISLKRGGGHGGHNGLRSLKKCLPKDDFLRVRFGIGRPPPRWDPADYVLARFASGEQRDLETLTDQAARLVEDVVAGVVQAENTSQMKNGRNRSGSPEPGSVEPRGRASK